MANQPHGPSVSGGDLTTANHHVFSYDPKDEHAGDRWMRAHLAEMEHGGWRVVAMTSHDDRLWFTMLKG